MPGVWEGSKWRKHRQVLRRYPRNSGRAQDDRTVKWWAVDGKPLLDLGKRPFLLPIPDDKDYQVPFNVTGKIDKLTISAQPPKLTPDDIKKLKEAERKQADAG